MKYHLYVDPCHGWLRVPIRELEKLGIAEKISKYSYMIYADAFLEEDVDLTLFDAAMKANDSSWNLEDNMKEHISNKTSPIRNYKRYNYQTHLQESSEK